MNILMVLTSHEQLGNSGYKTGIWLDGFTTAYYILKDAGAEISLASPQGLFPPIDPRSDQPGNQTDSIRRFKQDTEARTLLADTLRLDQVDASDFDAVLVPGGHGPMWDLADDLHCRALMAAFHADCKPMAFVCHGAAALRRAVDERGIPLVHGKAVTGFANSEEDAAGLSAILPFLLQDELIRLGGRYSKGPDGTAHIVRDGLLLMGQNVASAAGVARELVAILQGRTDSAL